MKFLQKLVGASIVFIFLSAMLPAFASVNFENEAEFIYAVSSLRKDGSISPQEKSKTLQSYKAKILDKDWPVAKLNAEILELELAQVQQDHNLSRDRVTALKSIAQELGDYEAYLRLNLVELGMLTYTENVKETVKKQQYLLEKAMTLDSLDFTAELYSEVGRSQIVLSNWQGAIISLQKAHDLYSLRKNYEGLGGVLNMLGSINISMKNYDTAIKYFEEVIDIAKKQGDEFRESIILFNIGEAYSEQQEYEKAREYHENALDMSLKLEDTIGVAYAQAALGDVAAATENCEKAIRLYDTSYKEFSALGNARRQIVILLGMTRCYLDLSKPDIALEKLNEIKKIQNTLNDTNTQHNYYGLLADTLYMQGEYQNAFLALKDKVDIAEQLQETEREQEIYKYKIQFEAQLVEEQNEVLQAQNELSTLKIMQQDKEERIWVIISVLSALTIVAMVWLLVMKIRHSNRFRRLALYDQLTSSPNRRNILKQGEEVFEKAENSKTPISVVIVDLDYFKRINDTFGHDVGDKVLKAFAKVCKVNLRSSDRYGRYGGEEWLFIFDHDNDENIKATFSRIQSAIDKQRIEGMPADYKVTFSGGVSRYEPDEKVSFLELIARADKRLYAAKDKGRNQIVF